jgi:hypothetical protein
MLNDITLSVDLMSVVMLSVIMLNVIMLSVVRLSVMAPLGWLKRLYDLSKK